jgi:hypothetical protein
MRILGGLIPWHFSYERIDFVRATERAVNAVWLGRTWRLSYTTELF